MAGRLLTAAFIAAAFGSGVTPGFAQSTGCAEEVGMRSVSDAVPAEITFVNATNVELSLYWIDFSGRRIAMGPLAAHTNETVETFAGHPWVVEDSAGVCQGVFFGERNPRTVVVDAVG